MLGGIQKYFNKKGLKDAKYSYLFDEYAGDEAICFDCETTGLNPKKDEILSIGAVKIKGNRILTSQKLELFVKPEGEIASEAIKIHHIREIDAQKGIEASEAIFKFLEFVGNRDLVGYYLEFDVAMINKYLKKILGITLPNRQIDISALYYDKKIEIIPQGNIDLRFDKILEDLKIPLLGKHSAIADATMSAVAYVKLKNIKRINKE